MLLSRRGKIITIVAAALLCSTVLFNLAIVLIYSTVGTLSVKITRFVVVAVLACGLIKGYQWARILTMIIGFLSLIFTVTSFFIYDGVLAITQWQEIFMVSLWIIAAIMMAIPYFGAREYMSSQKLKRSEQNDVGNPVP